MARKPATRDTKAPAKRGKAASAAGARSRGKAQGQAKNATQSKRETTKSSGKKTSARVRAPKEKPPVTVDLVQSRANFVRYYIEQDFKNGAEAYKRAYGEKSDEVACSSASRLLADVKVQEALSAELEAVLKDRRRPLEKRILDTWLIRAFYDPTEIIDLEGRLKITVAQLRKKGLQVCIDSINKKLNSKGDEYLEYKLADRDKALDMLQKYIAMIREPDKNLNVTVGGGVLRVPIATSPEDWAAVASAQQAALLSEGRHA